MSKKAQLVKKPKGQLSAVFFGVTKVLIEWDRDANYIKIYRNNNLDIKILTDKIHIENEETNRG